MFPPLEDKQQSENFTEYSAFNYWRDTLPDLQEELNRMKEEEDEKKRKLTGSPFKKKP